MHRPPPLQADYVSNNQEAFNAIATGSYLHLRLTETPLMVSFILIVVLAVSVLTMSVMAILFLYEMGAYLFPGRVEHLAVDTMKGGQIEIR